MVRARRLRRDYNTVPVTAEEDEAAAVNEVFQDEVGGEESGVDLEAPPAAPSSTSRRSSSGRQRREYQTVSTTASEEDEEDELEEQQLEEDEEEEEGTKITVVVMDPAQKKFPIEAYTHWKVEQFKRVGEKVHKVAPPSQRLIYRGQLLQDDKTLEEHGINDDKLIIHLFPKPRVIIQSQTSSCGGAAATDDESSSEPNDGGAHIPQIVLNADEAERRSTILVLGSTDFLEAQNNVKLFSFLLLVISSIELFNLLLILMGVPPDSQNTNSSATTLDNGEDDFFHINMTTNNNDDFFGTGSHSSSQTQYNSQYDDAIQRELQTWHFSNNFDLAISALGIYVALLGIRATNETTLRLAKQYLVGTFVVGVLWMIYNYWFTVHVDEEIDHIRREERHNLTNSTSTSGGNSTIGNHTHPNTFDDDDIPEKSDWDYYQQNMSLMMIPGMVWILCCVRAWQFQSLLEEAEREAEERIRNELEQHRVPSTIPNTGNENSNAAEDEGPGDEETPIANGEASRRQQGGQDLELQNSFAVMT